VRTSHFEKGNIRPTGLLALKQAYSLALENGGIKKLEVLRCLWGFMGVDAPQNRKHRKDFE
jgi:hypothetical protein